MCTTRVEQQPGFDVGARPFHETQLAKRGTNCEPLSRFSQGPGRDAQCRTVLQPHVPTDPLSHTVVLATERQRWKVSWARSPPGQRTWTLLPVGGAGSPQHLWSGFQAPAPPLKGSIPSLFNGRSCMIRSEVTHTLKKQFRGSLVD